jgi:hypothetical protein
LLAICGKRFFLQVKDCSSFAGRVAMRRTGNTCCRNIGGTLCGRLAVVTKGISGGWYCRQCCSFDQEAATALQSFDARVQQMSGMGSSVGGFGGGSPMMSTQASCADIEITG